MAERQPPSKLSKLRATKPEGLEMKSPASTASRTTRPKSTRTKTKTTRAASRPRTAGARTTAKPTAKPKPSTRVSPPSPGATTQPAGLLPEHFPDSQSCSVIFQCFKPDAGEVLVAGSFNGWQPRVTPMTPMRGGQWSAEVLLEPGRYEYRFLIDGQWQDDPLSACFVANPFGGLNGVVEVKPPTAEAARAAARH
jgi:hypothetical protein